MEVELRDVGVDRLEEFLRPVATAFGFVGPPEAREQLARIPELDVRLGAFDGEALVGAAGSFSFDLTVPGGTVPAAGLTMVGVLATHRRRGILRTLMRRYLDDARERGHPVSALWATEGAIYGRFGYGLGSLAGEVEVDRDSPFVEPSEPVGRTRLLEEDEALELFPRVWEAVRPEIPGMLSRSREWWEVRRVSDPEWRRRGGGALQRVVLELDGQPAGYALYRHHGGFEHGLFAGSIQVGEAIAATPLATRELWRYLLSIDLARTVKAGLVPVDHPLLFLLADPARLRLRLADGLWVRVVDVGAAFAARRLAGDGEVVLELDDPFCPWNTGHWAVGPHGAERTESPGEIALGAPELGSVYLGGFTFAQLAASGRVEELEPGALERADALFRTGRAPWCPEIF